MNTRLVESLMQIIQSLTPEEQIFLEEKLKQQKLSSSEQQKREQLRNKIYQRRKGEAFNPPIDEYIYITRDERTTQQDEMLHDCFGKKPNS
ncbi:hypothetical protein IQ247_21890 [Plectonema cf. radiosum LEGE 06105]|uniref:Uncharacterized protein n=1 Tax=Plectonema cf. radiosum LEGE 06105 TaxID=945769 RepID=A0A8J7JUQ1_9CYAN|nr:hypothetical protein [Plectonema radiosum]MBE9215279.1 hypothetical protein [Plectonema cf. radiosum LEGE 06105]